MDYYIYLLVLLLTCIYNNSEYNGKLYLLSLARNIYELISWNFFNILESQLLFDYILFLISVIQIFGYFQVTIITKAVF